MKNAEILALLAMLGTGIFAGAGRPAEASVLRRAYFRAETPEARLRLASFPSREFPGGMYSATVPAATLETLAASPGLTFIGLEALFHPAPIAVEEVRAAATRWQAAADPVRPCLLPDWIPQVGWGIKAMYDDPNLPRPSGGAGVRVGVIDSGVSPHLDLVRRLVKCADLTPSEILPPCADSLNHGTLVASVIAADGGFDGLGMYGMAPDASIYSYRVCDPGDACWGSYVAAGIYAAIADEVNIINLSLAGPGRDEAVKAAIDSAVAHNILVVVAAGNSPPYSYVAYPAVHPEVVSVGAIKETLAPWAYGAAGVNDGDYVREEQEIEVAAPGVAVLSGLKNGCYVLASGTSLAAPMVSGLAAKLWNGDAADVRRRLQNSARAHDLYVAGDDTLTGFGLPTTTAVFQITATASPGGTVSPSGPVLLAAGATPKFTIAPSGNCSQIQDVEVDGVSQGPISSYTFTHVTAGHTIHARFFPSGAFTINASAGPGGTISPSGASSVACGGSRSYTIAPSNGCQAIQDVKVDGVSRGPISSYTFTNVSAGHTIQASFVALGPFTIQASPDPGGNIDPYGATLPCGASGTFTITPWQCRQILNVKVDGVPQGPISSYTFTNVRSNHTIQASYSSTSSPTITAIAGPGGTISPGGTSGVPCGGNRTYTITPGYCHRIQDVKVDGVSLGVIPIYFFSGVTTNHTIEATFSPSAMFTITASAEPGGTISPSGASSVACGRSQNYTITPADCHAVLRVLVDGVSKGAISSYRFTDLGTSHTIVAYFSGLGPFAIDASAGPGGTVSPSGASSVACAGSRSYMIAPSDDCHRIQNVEVDGVSKGPITSYTFANVTAGHTIQATFSTLGSFIIDASAAPGSSISPSGATGVACGASQSYTIAPAEACRVIGDVQVDGVSVGAPGTYTFRDVQGSHTISAASAPSGLALAETHTGATWTGLSDGAIDLTVAGGVPPYAYAWSHGATSQDVEHLAAGAYEVMVTDAQGCASRLSVTIVNVGPAELAMSLPAPNPARGTVRLRYGIPAQVAVRLSVLDLQGREVAVLAQGTQPAGWSWAAWSGETSKGLAPGGVYFVRLQAGGRQLVQRFALIR